MKTVRIRNTAIATDILTCKIYHTAINEDNLLSSSVSSSGVFTGADLAAGLTFQVEDNISQFFVKNLTTCVNIGSGSLTENSNVVEFILVDPGSGGSVTITGESETTTSNSSTTRHNFSLYPSFTMEITPTYPNVFTGWFTGSGLTGTAVSTSNPLTLNSGSFDSATSWYAKYN